MSINELPNELVCDILEHCDNFRDYYNWNLVCRKWSWLMTDATKNIINRLLFGHKYTCLYVVSRYHIQTRAG